MTFPTCKCPGVARCSRSSPRWTGTRAPPWRTSSRRCTWTIPSTCLQFTLATTAQTKMRFGSLQRCALGLASWFLPRCVSCGWVAHTLHQPPQQIKPTVASYTLHDPAAVMRFLQQLVQWGLTQDNRWHKDRCVGGRLHVMSSSHTQRQGLQRVAAWTGGAGCGRRASSWEGRIGSQGGRVAAVPAHGGWRAGVM